MKRLTIFCIFIILLTACGPKPQDIVNAWQEALNKGDVDGALSYLADDVAVSLSPPGPDGDGTYQGKEEVRGWYETIVAAKGTGTMSNCQSDGDTFTCVSTFADEGLMAIGVDSIEGSWVAVVKDGKIQSYTFTISPESLAKFPPPPPAPQELINAWQEALNQGDIDGALSYLADDVAVSLSPPGPDGDGTYQGKEEVRGWYETIVAAKGIGTMSNCQSDGDTFTCVSTYADEGLKTMGVDSVEGSWVAVVKDGKIQSYTFTISPESLAKFPPPPPAPQELINAWQEALNQGDIDGALSYVADDVAVDLGSAGPEGDGTYQGKQELRGWYETIVAAKGIGTMSNCQSDGDTFTCVSTYADEGLKTMGVDSVEGSWVGVVKDGKIQSYTFTISPESLAKFPPPPTALPVEEVRITDAETLVGTWIAKSGKNYVTHRFKPDGRLAVEYTGYGTIGTGKYLFEGDLLKFVDNSGDCVGMVGLYEVYGIYEGGVLTKLRFVLNGEDACGTRVMTLNGGTLVAEP